MTPEERKAHTLEIIERLRDPHIFNRSGYSRETQRLYLIAVRRAAAILERELNGS